MKLELPAPRFAVPGLIAEGLSVLGGKPKLGKSWAALSLAIAISQGGHAFGSIPVDKGDTLYLALEDTERRFMERLGLLLNGDPEPDCLNLAFEWPKFNQGGLDFLDSWLNDHPNTRLVIIDTLARIRPPRKPKADIYQEDYDAGVDLKRLADTHRIAILLIHHLRKGGGRQDTEDWTESLSGSMGLGGAADSVLILDRKRGETNAVLKVTGRDIEEQILPLQFDSERAWVTADRTVDTPAVIRRSAARQEILDVLNASTAPLAPADIARELGKDANSVRQLVFNMKKVGDLAEIGVSGRYSATDAVSINDNASNGNGLDLARGSYSLNNDSDVIALPLSTPLSDVRVGGVAA
jgi:hypothetical protein